MSDGKKRLGCMMPGCQKRAGYAGIRNSCSRHPDGIALCGRHYRVKETTLGCPVCEQEYRDNQAEADRRNAAAYGPALARKDATRKRYSAQGYSGAALDALVAREHRADPPLPPKVTVVDIEKERAHAKFMETARKCPSCGYYVQASQGVILHHTLQVRRHWDDFDPDPTCPGTGMLAED